MAPDRAAIMEGRTARVIRTVAMRLSVREVVQSSSVMLRKPPRRVRAAPTLLMRTSMEPCASAAAARSAGPDGVDRSTATNSTGADATRASRSSELERAPATTRAPSAASARAAARPMPRLAPVTIATLPSSSSCIRSPLAIARECRDHELWRGRRARWARGDASTQRSLERHRSNATGRHRASPSATTTQARGVGTLGFSAMNYWVTYPLTTHPYNPEFTTKEGLTRFCQVAEAAGFAGIGFTDHPLPTERWLKAGGHDALDPFAALSFCAAVTDRMRLIPNILV